jgi:hypothetical protein
VVDRISCLKVKIDIKEIKEDKLYKRQKSCKRNNKELCDFIRRLNLRIKAFKGEEVQEKVIFKVIIAENS